MNNFDFNRDNNGNEDFSLNKYLENNRKLKGKGDPFFKSREQNTFERYIENLRSKPDYIKKRILFIGTFSATTIIIFIWFIVFLFGGEKDSQVILKDGDNKKDNPATFESFNSRLKDLEEEGKKILNIFSDSSTTTTDNNDLDTALSTSSDQINSNTEELEPENNININQDI